MAVQLDPSVKDDLKTQFVTREGTYRLMTLSEYSRPNRVGYTNSQSSPQVRVSIVSLPSGQQQQQQQQGQTTTCNIVGGRTQQQQQQTNQHQQQQQQQQQPPGITTLLGGYNLGTSSGSIESRLGVSTHMNDQQQNGLCGGGTPCGGDRICFNFGKELYVYAFRGVKKGSELSKPIDKKLYKGTNPSCHDFNAANATPDGAPLLVGFTTGQIQLVQPGRREPGKLYNEERLIDKTKVTCLKWLPGSTNLFLASHSSGHLYLYNEELPCTPAAPIYQSFKIGDGYTILTCKSKSTRNPLYKWMFSTENCCINEFCFSPCGSNLAIVSQDGFLRVFHYDTMELLGIARSYFGGFLCVCWSPDGKYIVVGGEDDLVTVWSLHERRVVARGQGHRSWVSVVAFDPYTTYNNWDVPDFSDDENPTMNEYRFNEGGYGDCAGYDHNEKSNSRRPNSGTFRGGDSNVHQQQQDKFAISYRLGSVSQDTQLCLWDITEDILRHPLTLRQRVSSINNETGGIHLNGELVNDIKVIKPIVSTNNPNNPSNKDEMNSNSCNSSSKNSSSNSNNSSKFSTANCTISSNDSGGGGGGVGGGGCSESAAITNSKHSNCNNNTNSSKQNKQQQSNCVNNINSINMKGDLASTTGTATTTVDGGNNSNNSGNNKSTLGSSKSSELTGLSAFNSLTQRLSNFSFGNDKNKSSSSSNDHYHQHHSSHNRHNNHRKTFSLSKSSGSSYNNHHSNTLQSNNSSNTHGGGSGSGGVGVGVGVGIGSINLNNDGNNSISSLKNNNSKSSQSSSLVVSSYDPMKLIGTPACPRFDECPLLEPLICKKIAHERLTALIFREDCFLTACQDGFIYTWARPGYSNVPQHMSPSQNAPPGGTVV